MANRKCFSLIMFFSASFFPVFAVGEGAEGRNIVASKTPVHGEELNTGSVRFEPDPRVSQPEYEGVDNLYIHNRTTNHIDKFSIIQAGANTSVLLSPLIEVENMELYHTYFAWKEGFPLEFAVVAVFADGCEIRTNFVAELSREQQHSVFLDITKQRTFSIRVKKPFVRNLRVTRIVSGGIFQKEEDRIRQYQKLAEEGNAEAQVALGEVYGSRLGEANTTEAIKWYRKAADQGSVRAQFKLGSCYAEGLGVAKDVVEAIRWFQLAADQEESYSQYYLGQFYEEGIGVEKDEVEAAKWYIKAAENDRPPAMYKAGLCYSLGSGVKRNDAKAVAWYRKAAEEGYPEAAYRLGLSYRQGLGVEKNEQEALKWFQGAAARGNIQAKELLESEQVKEGHQRWRQGQP